MFDVERQTGVLRTAFASDRYRAAPVQDLPQRADWPPAREPVSWGRACLGPVQGMARGGPPCPPRRVQGPPQASRIILGTQPEQDWLSPSLTIRLSRLEGLLKPLVTWVCPFGLTSGPVETRDSFCYFPGAGGRASGRWRDHRRQLQAAGASWRQLRAADGILRRRTNHGCVSTTRKGSAPVILPRSKLLCRPWAPCAARRSLRVDGRCAPPSGLWLSVHVGRYLAAVAHQAR